MGTLMMLPLCGQAYVRKLGGASRDRTGDLLHAMQALSQLSYGPTCAARSGILAMASCLRKRFLKFFNSAERAISAIGCRQRRSHASIAPMHSPSIAFERRKPGNVVVPGLTAGPTAKHRIAQHAPIDKPRELRLGFPREFAYAAPWAEVMLAIQIQAPLR